jgi:predicted transposase/invertase (TIGR01784 family)
MYDNICKFLAEQFSGDFARWILGEPLPLTKLSPTELSNEPIRADALILLQSPNLVLHLEFQTAPHAAIPFRMADYRLRVHRRFPQKTMRQVVIYLQPSNSPLVFQNTFDISGLRHQFEIIRLWEQPTADLLLLPGLLPLAILGRTTDKAQTLREIEAVIDTIEDRREQSNLIAATSILAGLVLDKTVIQQILREDIMKESVIYQDILQQGEREGEQRGIKRGQVSLILRQLNHRLGEIDSELSSRIELLSSEQLTNLGEALLDFSDRQDLITWLSENPA